MKTIRLPARPNYPRVIYYSTEAYRVRYKKNLGCFGVTDPETKTITIRAGLSPRSLLATLVHEILHVIEFETPVKIKHKQVYKLEKALVEILLDNFF